MGYRINTNIGAMTAHVSGVMNNRNLDLSLQKLSSGLRINSAADDASGMSIADSLRSQSNSLGQAIKNANDAIGILQIADKAMDEQIKILDTVKTKATQAAQDGQSTLSRTMIQQDIVQLLAELDNIANTTTFNGQTLLAGNYTNKEFQIGAYSNQVVKASIGATSSDKIGSIRYETTSTITAGGTSSMIFSNPDGTSVSLQSVTISNSANTGLGVLTDAINKASDTTGVRASFKVVTTGSAAILSGDIYGLAVNGITIGDILDIKPSDATGNLVNAINSVTSQTGIYASTDIMGRLVLTSNDGRGINVTSTSAASAVASVANFSASENYGRLTLVQLNSKQILVTDSGPLKNAITAGGNTAVNLRDVTGNFTTVQALASGTYANTSESGGAGVFMGSGVTTRNGAQMVMDIAQSAQLLLDKVRSGLGSAQIQLVSTINNISITQVNVAAAESQIRDVDFAEESANFSKTNILAQSGSFAQVQANAVQQNVLKLLQ